MNTADYNKCVDEQADAVYRFILKNLRDTDKAQDVVQDSFEKMWIKHEEIPAEKAKSYLFTTAYHTMIDGIRKDSKQTQLENKHTNILTVTNNYSDLKEVLNEALEQLPQIQKSALLLRDYEGYSYEEIGEITGLNEAQVKVYIFRARTTMKNYIVNLDLVV